MEEKKYSDLSIDDALWNDVKNNGFKWIDFYTKFATKLLSYKNDRTELIKKIRCVYDNVGIDFPKLDSDGAVIDVDPFTVFGMFNKWISDANQSRIIEGMANEFGVDAIIPTRFDGIPLLNNRNSVFYHFKENRGEHDIDNLWDVFESALALSENDTVESRDEFIERYNIIHGQSWIRWKITMGLYWIRPYFFLNLDRRSRWFITNKENMPEDFVALAKRKKLTDSQNAPALKAEDYLEIRDACEKALESGEYKYKTIPELSYASWFISEKVNHENDQKNGDEGDASNAAFLRWFEPLIKALRELGGFAKRKQVLEKIIEDEGLSNEELDEMGNTLFEKQVDFARFYLAYAGYIVNVGRGEWKLTELGETGEMNDEIASDIFKKYSKEHHGGSGKGGNALADNDVNEVHYWTCSPGRGAEKWDEFYRKGIIALGWGEIGDLLAFSSKDEIKQAMKNVYGDTSTYINSAHAVWQFSREMKQGDIIYAKRGMNEIIGRGIVQSDYEYDDTCPDDFKHVRSVNWTDCGSWEPPSPAAMKTLTDITPYTDYVNKLESIFKNEEEDDDIGLPMKGLETYDRDKFLEKVYMNEDDYDILVDLIKTKKNVILEGPPGVGKTFAAKRLAYSIMGVQDPTRVKMIQFHQSYSYEDFIMGWRPNKTGGYDMKSGVFYNFCKKAEEDDISNGYYFIIDEINRGNLSKIFGEVFMLIEDDKRDDQIQLLYEEEKFSIPQNVYIIGTMNTADRSLAMMDYALRRRFAFYPLQPGFESDGFGKYQEGLENQKFDELIKLIIELNDEISSDESLGKGFRIGHSFFCKLDELDERSDIDKALERIVNYELIPLLNEYWIEESDKVEDWAEKLRGAIK